MKTVARALLGAKHKTKVYIHDSCPVLEIKSNAIQYRFVVYAYVDLMLSVFGGRLSETFTASSD